MSDLTKNQQSIDTSGAHVDGGDVEALRAQFKELLSDSRRACFYEGDSQYAYPHDFSWFFYQAGYAAAKAETADAVAKERERATEVLASFIPEWDGQEAVDGGDLIRMLIDAIRAGVKEPGGDPAL